MLHVTEMPEPPDFDTKVRKKGLAYLRKNQIELNQPIPTGVKIENYWVDCLPELYESYQGICAYVAVHFERVTANGSVDHFAPKSLRADLAYEWRNYRLSCSRMNSRKNDYQDVLDPFEIQDGYFHLELITGRIYANTELAQPLKEMVAATIERLGLDDAGCRTLRAKHYSDYIGYKLPSDYFRKMSPFVWYEANRQGLL